MHATKNKYRNKINNVFVVAVSVCDGLQGYIQTERDGFIIRPYFPSTSITAPHTLTKIPTYRNRYNEQQENCKKYNVHNFSIFLSNQFKT